MDIFDNRPESRVSEIRELIETKTKIEDMRNQISSVQSKQQKIWCDYRNFYSDTQKEVRLCRKKIKSIDKKISKKFKMNRVKRPDIFYKLVYERSSLYEKIRRTGKETRVIRSKVDEDISEVHRLHLGETELEGFKSNLYALEEKYDHMIYKFGQKIIEEQSITSGNEESIVVFMKKDNSIHILFGGLGTPDGPDHGHIVIEPEGFITYARNAGEERGPQNYINI